MNLYSRLFVAGTKIKVSSEIKNNLYPPNSIIFISSAYGNFRENPNIAVLNGTLVRKGKRGMHRLENSMLTTNIFDIERKAKKLKSGDYRGYAFVHVLPVEMDKNILKMSNIDLVGWGRAYRIYIRNMYANLGIGARWPKSQSNPVNLLNNPENLTGALTVFSDENMRIGLITTLRKMESTITTSIMANKRACALIELKASAYLIWDNLCNGRLYDKEVLYRNYLYYKCKYEEARAIATACGKNDCGDAFDDFDVKGVHMLTRHFKAWLDMTPSPKNKPDFQVSLFTQRKENPIQKAVEAKQTEEQATQENSGGLYTYGHSTGRIITDDDVDTTTFNADRYVTRYFGSQT